MSASREWTGASNSRRYMDPRARAEVLCDELRSGARPMHATLGFCICKEVVAMLRAATGVRAKLASNASVPKAPPKRKRPEAK